MSQPVRPRRLLPGSTALATLVVVAFAAAACGGGGGGRSSGPPLSKADYITAANAACAEDDAAVNAMPQPTITSPLEAWAAFLGKADPLLKSTLTRLQALTPPSTDKPTIDSLLALGTSAYTQTERLRAAAAARDTNAFNAALTAYKSTTDEFNQIANSYGLDVCGRSS